MSLYTHVSHAWATIEQIKKIKSPNCSSAVPGATARGCWIFSLSGTDVAQLYTAVAGRPSNAVSLWSAMQPLQKCVQCARGWI